MIKEKIGKIFDFISETNLTEEDFYENEGNYPVYSGQTENDGIISHINSYNQEKPCITFTTYGSAGKLSYREGNFTIGRNCMGLRPKVQYEEQIILEWFVYKFQNLFYRLRIGDPQGQKSLNKLLLNNIEIIIPEKDSQQRELSYYKEALKIFKKLSLLKSELKNIQKSNTSFEVKYTDTIKDIFSIVSGNSGLTEELIYDNQPSNEDEKIKILSGATTEIKILGYVNKNSKPNNKKLKIFKSPFTHIIRKGLAGRMTYFDSGEYTANDDIYILTVKKEWQGKVNLRWFTYQYQERFYNLVTSKSDNATFNKEYIEKQIIKIPNENFQNNLAEKLLKIDFLIEKLNEIEDKLNNLIESEII